MDIHSIQVLLKTRSIYDFELRVTYYARVSSESDKQLNSLDNQFTEYSADGLSRLSTLFFFLRYPVFLVWQITM